MDFDDLLKIAFKISSAWESVDDLEVGDEETLPTIKTKVKGRKVEIVLTVKRTG